MRIVGSLIGVHEVSIIDRLLGVYIDGTTGSLVDIYTLFWGW
jgi:hypothetical protein